MASRLRDSARVVLTTAAVSIFIVPVVPAAAQTNGGGAAPSIGTDTVGQRLTRESIASVASTGRVANRVQNRVQNRIENRIDPYYKAVDAASAVQAANAEQVRATRRSVDPSSRP